MELNIVDLGAKCDGLTDDTLIILNAIETIGAQPARLIIPGPTKVSRDLTFGASTEVAFQPGGKLVGSGVELIQFQTQIRSGPYQIFENCAPKACLAQTVRPEWWGIAADGASGAQIAFNSAYEFLENTGGTIQMQPVKYTLTGPILVKASCAVVLQGAGQALTVLQVEDPKGGTCSNGIEALGSPGSPLRDLVFNGFSLRRSPATSLCFGIKLFYAALAKFQDIEIAEFLFGAQLRCATDTFFTRVGASYSGTSNGFIGFAVWCGENDTTDIKGNASSVFRDCWVDSFKSPASEKVGYRIYGSYVADLIFDSCATAGTDYGYFLDYSTAVAFVDVHILNAIIDQYTLHGIHAAGMSDHDGAMLTIRGGWINPAPVLGETHGILLQRCRGVAISNVQIQADHPGNHIGVMLTSCDNVVVSNCLFARLSFDCVPDLASTNIQVSTNCHLP